MMTEENFIKAERLLSKNKPKNRKAKIISENAEYYGKLLYEKVKTGYEWHKPKRSTICDTYKGKVRNLKIPCLEDQAAQLAWLNIATPYIERRNYYYNCGSIPNAGQTRCVNALKKWLKNPKMKYGAVLDIRKFYDTCPHSIIRKGLERIFKDKKFVDYAMGFVSSMSDNDVGIAIGYPVSHWLANIALCQLDHDLQRIFPNIKYTRYMDDIALVSTNKRKLRKAVDYINFRISEMGMELKKFSLFPIKGRGLTYLSYRFFNGYTILSKRLMFRISKRIRKVKQVSRHIACGIMSYLGILSHCNSYNFRIAYVYPFITKRLCANIIRRSDANYLL